MTRRLGVVALAAMLACTRTEAPLEVSKVTLSGGVVAKVGDIDIPESLVGAVAAARGIAPREAVQLLIDDALAAAGARDRKLEAFSIVNRDLNAARARMTAMKIREITRANPPTDGEVEEFAHYRRTEVDLPEQVRVIHAVVLREPAIKGQDEEGMRLAREIAAAVAPATNEATFQSLAAAVDARGRKVRVEELPPLVRDGRVAAPGNNVMDATFSAAASDIPKAGATSNVVETSFGWHVIRLIERLPAKKIPPEEWRAYFAEDIYAARGRRDLSGVLTAARARARPEINTAAEALMSEVVVGQQ